MNLKQAYALLKEKIKSRPTEEEARKLVTADQLKKVQENKMLERSERTRKITEMGKRFPNQSNQVFSECHKCSSRIDFNGAIGIRRNTRILRLATCECGAINVECIWESKLHNVTEYDRYLGMRGRDY